MRIAAVLLFGLALTVALLGKATAQDTKETTIKGTITCAKCDLGVEKKCATVLQVKKGDKETLYYFDKTSNSKYHGDTCKEAKKGSVTGTVTEKDGKKMIAVTSLKYN